MYVCMCILHSLVDEVGVEYGELGRRVVEVVVGLVVLVPVPARLHAVQIARLARPILVLPPVRRPG